MATRNSLALMERLLKLRPHTVFFLVVAGLIGRSLQDPRLLASPHFRLVFQTLSAMLVVTEVCCLLGERAERGRPGGG